MQWFKDLNTMAKLMLSFGIILAFTAGIGILASHSLAEEAATNDLLFQRDVMGLINIKDFEIIQAKIASTTGNAIIAAAKQSGQSDVDLQEKQFEDLFAQLESKLKLISATVYRPNMRTIVASLTAMLPGYRQHCQTIFVRARAGDPVSAGAALKENEKFTDELNKLAGEASRVKFANLREARSNEAKSAKTTETALLTWLALTVLLGLGISFAIARSFSVPLIAAVNLLEKLSQGDLTHRLAVTSSDEIGTLAVSVNRAIGSMDAALFEVGHSAKNLSDSAAQLARAAEGLANGAQEQAASLEETSASLEEITATIRQNSDNAKHASQLAVSSRDSAEKGGASAVETVAAMGEIRASSAKISEIIGTIDEIAFQTNLLSVNASVEAARAGVHGNGFKVVATEVRNLAQRSAAAAKEIKALITSSVRKVENGSTLVATSGATLKEIVSSVKRVSDIVGEIAAASQEQATGIEQVGKAMTQMDRVTQSNSSQTEELSATASSLAAQSSHLEGLVDRFILSKSSGVDLAPASAERHLVVSPASAPAAANSPISDAIPAPGVVPPDSAKDHALKEDLSVNLQSMARNIGQSFISKTHDKEFEEF